MRTDSPSSSYLEFWKNDRRIDWSELFDEAYYRACYAESLKQTGGAYEHFLTEGLTLGYKPNPAFDPLVYFLRHRSAPENTVCDTGKPCAPSPASGDDASIASCFPSILKPQSYLPARPMGIDREQDNVENLRHADTYAAGVEIDFSIREKRYRLVAPPASALLERLRADRPFAFARLPHGFWDGLFNLERHRRSLMETASAWLPDSHIDRLAERLCDEFYPEKGIFTENFLPEILNDLAEADHGDSNFMQSVCFKGFPTSDNRLFYRNPEPCDLDKEILAIFSGHFPSGAPLYDATAWKRWLIAGPLKALPQLVRSRPIVFMGPERLAALPERWDLPYFQQVIIPHDNTYPLRHVVLEQCRSAIATAKVQAHRHGTARPIFLTQGGSLAYWMIKRLYKTDPDIFYLDLGQALNGWFFDLPEIEVLEWSRLYRSTIERNCGFGSAD